MEMEMERARGRQEEGPFARWFTPLLVRTKLHALAAMLNFKPSMRHHLAHEHPAGVPFTFDATMEFVTHDRRSGAHIVFNGGKARVRSGPAREADVTARFKTLKDMRRFFAGEDSFNMLLDKTLLLEGNLSYLFKFGHISADASGAGKGGNRDNGHGAAVWPGRWQEMSAYPTGEPCEEAPAEESAHLEDPHMAASSLDDFPEIKRLLWEYRVAKPAICSERPRLLTEYLLSSKQGEDANDPVVLRQAKALRHVMRHKRPIIRDGDLLAGTTTSHPVGVIIHPELGGTGIWPELLTVQSRELNPYTITAEEIRVLDQEVFPFWMEDNLREWTRRENGRPDALELDERFVFYFMWKTQAASHTVIDVPRALGRGLRDIIDEAARKEAGCGDPQKHAFYQATRVAMEGVLEYAENLALHAEELAEAAEQPTRRRDLLELARICRKVPAEPAQTVHEAVQAIWTLFIAQHQENMNAGMVVGRLDTILQPFLERELQDADTVDEEAARVRRALELSCALMLKLTDHLPLVPDVGNRLFGGSSENQVITLGGLKPHGASAVCDMTWILLKATEMLHLKDPNVNARFAPGVNSEAYLRRLCEVNLLTGATPSLHNDDAMVPALLEQGFALEDARDWTATGCVEPTSCGRHFGHTNCMMFNLVAPLEMALNDGMHPSLGTQVGPRTGGGDTFQSYEALWGAFTVQLGWLIDKAVEANNMLGRAHQAIKPTPLLSALFTGPMEAGKDVMEGGAKYNTSGTAMIGLADVVDSLAALKTMVYGSGQVQMATLMEALDADFQGHDALLKRILNKAPKFGQDDELTNQIAREVMDFVFARFQSQEHYRGGKYLPGYWSMSNHVAFGLLSGALPSGRRRGKPFTPGLTPSHLSGASLTEQIRSVAGLDGIKTPNNIAFNVKVVPGGGDTHQEVVKRMAAYASAFFQLGGMQMQFNAVSSQTMRDAMDNPEQYGDLLVRISGYNAYFVQLNRDIQRELVERAEHDLGIPAAS